MHQQEEIKHQQQLLELHRRSLNHLLKQAALHGGESFAPPAVYHGIRQAREEIARIKQFLRRMGVSVADSFADTAGDTETEQLS